MKCSAPAASLLDVFAGYMVAQCFKFLRTPQLSVQRIFKWRRRHTSCAAEFVGYALAAVWLCRVDELCCRWRCCCDSRTHYTYCAGRKKTIMCGHWCVLGINTILADGDKVKVSVMLRSVDSRMDLDISQGNGKRELCVG